jgi:cyanate permease
MHRWFSLRKRRLQIGFVLVVVGIGIAAIGLYLSSVVSEPFDHSDAFLMGRFVLGIGGFIGLAGLILIALAYERSPAQRTG